MEQKDKELIDFAKRSLKSNLEKNLLDINRGIDRVKLDPENWDSKSNLMAQHNLYKERIKSYGVVYGVEFPNIEESYQKIVPKINEVLK